MAWPSGCRQARNSRDGLTGPTFQLPRGYDSSRVHTICGIRMDMAGLPCPALQDRSVAILLLKHFPILLQTRHSQSCHAAARDCPLPAGQFLDRQAIAGASFIERQKATIYGGDHLPLSTDRPSFDSSRRKILKRQSLAYGAYHMRWPIRRFCLFACLIAQGPRNSSQKTHQWCNSNPNPHHPRLTSSYLQNS